MISEASNHQPGDPGLVVRHQLGFGKTSCGINALDAEYAGFLDQQRRPVQHLRVGGGDGLGAAVDRAPLSLMVLIWPARRSG